MCGFIAYLGNDLEDKKSSFPKMLNEISHRGPDGKEELYFGNNSYFGHVRLSIIDKENSRQPMVSECGRYVLVFNGEIYNYLELRQELIRSGNVFRSYGDTEVLMKLLINMGPKSLNLLNGMFSFVFFDKLTNSWLAVRDHYGIKPLYYYVFKNGDIIFSSEIKAFFNLPEIKSTLNIDALYDYLQFQFILDEQTLFKGIKKIKPAFFLKGVINKAKEFSEEKWWRINYKTDFVHDEGWFVDRLHFLLHDSIKLQTRSDVSLGCYLSGGIDSSLISSLSSSYLKIKLPCFHGKFCDYPGYDESKYANEISNYSNLDLFEVEPTSEQFIEELPSIIKCLDEPLAGPGVFPQYMVSKEASKHVRVVLGGQGGDELFCGYARYLIAYLEQALKGVIEGTQEEGKYLVTLETLIPSLPSLKNYMPLIKKFISEGIFDSMNKRYFHIISRNNISNQIFEEEFIINYDFQKQFNKFNFIFESNDCKSYINKMTHFDMFTSLQSLLHIEDRVSMAWGIESRVPFLDFRIAELLAAVPPKLKFKGGELKSILKKFSKSFIPSSILNRSDKMGFPVPLSEWIKNGKVRDFVGDTLTSNKSLQRGIFKPTYLYNLIDSEREPAARDIWGALSLEIWHNIYIDK